mmetsp:Transcript_9346/g.56956  ORF Transcript_9346/g.56956 Transcript_9346/m.56956 type:complete len:90 (+) Transcript_9346:460-729(+)
MRSVRPRTSDGKFRTELTQERRALTMAKTARRPVKTPAMRKKSDAKHTRGFQKVGSTGSTHLECADVQWCLPTHSRDERTRSTPPHLAK